jgi:hypothetical protein
MNRKKGDMNGHIQGHPENKTEVTHEEKPHHTQKITHRFTEHNTNTKKTPE